MNVVTLFKIGSRLAKQRIRRSALVPTSTFEEELSRVGLDFTGWFASRVARQYVEIEPAAVAELERRYPEIAARTVAGAEQALAHRFDLLGSGPCAWLDPDRPARGSYRPIDWYFDPVRKLRFPRGIPYKQWKLYEMRPGNADIKYPWEIGRCQHFAALGQAYLLTGDVRFAREIVDEIDDFVEANPVGIGINWTCTMDVAIRAANWAIGLALIKTCAGLGRERFKAAYAAVFDHGRFIYANFENIYEVTSNHFLSNVVGLHFVAAEFAELPSAQAWDKYCRKSVETEIDVQILPDGADFESSVPYHRLVTELFLGSYRLAQIQQRPLSSHVAARLKDMAGYLAEVMRPDGLMPQVGDADDGRLHIFTDWAGWQRQDGRHLLGAAGAVLGEPSLLAAAGHAGGWEAGWWGVPTPGAAMTAATYRDRIGLFSDAGVFVACRGGNYLLVTNAKVGTKGFGNHKHNDQLGFEYHVGGVAIVVDPGSWVYTSDFEGRNLFRGTRYHNTLSIDGVEQNEFNPEWLFRMFEKADAEHIDHGNDDTHAWYKGRHGGYRRIEAPVVHARRFDFDLNAGMLAIEDQLDGGGEHDLVWHFHFAPGARIDLQGPGEARIRRESVALRLTYPAGLAPHVDEAWYSPSYGVRVPTFALELSVRVDVANAPAWRFKFEHDREDYMRARLETKPALPR